jgi:hypothetical protein
MCCKINAGCMSGCWSLCLGLRGEFEQWVQALKDVGSTYLIRNSAVAENVKAGTKSLRKTFGEFNESTSSSRTHSGCGRKFRRQ